MVSKIKMRAGSYLCWLPLAILFFGMFMAFAHYFNEMVAGGDPWKTGDWLINYRGGFVRRGGLGEIFLLISELLKVKLLWLTFFFQLNIYFVTLYFVARIYLARTRAIEWSILLLSPAFLLFAFYDYLGGFRKEVIAFAAFSILAEQYIRLKLSVPKLLTSYFLYFIGCISHELIALTCPFFLYIVHLSYKKNIFSQRTAYLSYIFFLTNAANALWIGIDFHGDIDAVNSICNSIVQQEVRPDICLGSIASLSVSYTGEVQAKLGDFIQIYMPIFALALLPVLASDWYQKDKLSFLILGVGLLCLAPLFFVAYDWGRWIHIFVYFITVLQLAQSVHMPIRLPKISAVLITLYLTLWMMPTLYSSGNTANGLIWRLVAYSRKIILFMS